MKKAAIILNILALSLIVAGCGSSIAEQRDHTSFPETEKIVEISETNPQNKPKITFNKEVWNNGDFNLKFPCEIFEKDFARQNIAAEETTETINCEIGNLKFSVSSKKSNKTLRAEFEKIIKEKKLSVNKHNGLTAIDYMNSTLTQKGTEPNLTFVSFSATRSRVYQINDKWLISMEVFCGSSERSYCEELLNFGSNNEIDEFFESVKINK